MTKRFLIKLTKQTKLNVNEETYQYILPLSQEERRAINFKYWNKKQNAAKKGIEFNLTLDNYYELVAKHKLTAKDINPNGYNLCRKDHSLGYELNNCYFDTHSSNSAEMHSRVNKVSKLSPVVLTEEWLSLYDEWIKLNCPLHINFIKLLKDPQYSIKQYRCLVEEFINYKRNN